MSVLIADTIEGNYDDDDEEEDIRDIPIPNVKAAVLAKVIEYCTHFQQQEMTPITTPLKSSKVEDLVQPWYFEFCSSMDQNMLFELVSAANYMDIKPLLDLACLAVAVYIKGKSAEELRRIFNMAEEFSPEEEEQVREENSWAQQPDQPERLD